MNLVKRLERREISIVFISHSLQQVFAVVDRIVVSRIGEVASVGKPERKTWMKS